MPAAALPVIEQPAKVAVPLAEVVTGLVVQPNGAPGAAAAARRVGVDRQGDGQAADQVAVGVLGGHDRLGAEGGALTDGPGGRAC